MQRLKVVQTDIVFNSEDRNTIKINDLIKLDDTDLLHRLELIDDQAIMLKWKIWLALKRKHKSTKAFGRRIKELKEQGLGYLIPKQQIIQRYYRAGEFCERHNIHSIEKIGLYQSSIYELTRVCNQDIADDIFQQIKKKHLPDKEVKRIISERKGLIVVDNQTSNQVKLDNSNVIHLPVTHDSEIIIRRRDLIQSMPSAETLTDDDIVNEIVVLCEQYSRSHLKMIPLIKTVITRLSAAGYGK